MSALSVRSVSEDKGWEAAHASTLLSSSTASMTTSSSSLDTIGGKDGAGALISAFGNAKVRSGFLFMIIAVIAIIVNAEKAETELETVVRVGREEEGRERGGGGGGGESKDKKEEEKQKDDEEKKKSCQRENNEKEKRIKEEEEEEEEGEKGEKGENNSTRTAVDVINAREKDGNRSMLLFLEEMERKLEDRKRADDQESVASDSCGSSLNIPLFRNHASSVSSSVAAIPPSISVPRLSTQNVKIHNSNFYNSSSSRSNNHKDAAMATSANPNAGPNAAITNPSSTLLISPCLKEEWLKLPSHAQKVMPLNTLNRLIHTCFVSSCSTCQSPISPSPVPQHRLVSDCFFGPEDLESLGQIAPSTARVLVITLLKLGRCEAVPATHLPPGWKDGEGGEG
eukprot:CAMPEP_0175069030 /NCGR_PEP_ID=MMETSP0052_2-20121109/17983_1 /TAXON_ID=51329 ORGANISM="Polytomella parva, Strain SAG 63-3" /NCGR_SAMPLE_ID=MMETSP0052_2 /ASSEMBLY_ACC=CAM_ASM_000194 /LENGTH=396 /DNA_ID=CAMNT_0016336089 /DNA_START=1397 /DNA_END=2583 /DNA_ORIENTATION=-